MKRFVLTLILLVLAVAPFSSAGPLSPKPLQTDRDLAALIAVRGQFTSLIVDEQRTLTLPVWAADFSPNERVDFEELESRSFSQLELPEEAGWGLFTPSGDYLDLQVRITDQRGRLGRVEFRRADNWQLVGSVWANPVRTEAAGVLSFPSDLREMVAEVMSDTGGILARIAVGVGKFDRVVPVLVPGHFQPQHFPPVYCQHAEPAPGDTYGEPGNPYSPPGTKSGVSSEFWFSTTCAHVDFTNDSMASNPVDPPYPFYGLVRAKTINTLNLNRFKVGDPQDLQNLAQAVNQAASEDWTPALLPAEAPPYSEGCVRWNVRFFGRALAVLAIPYERGKRQRTLEAFVQVVATLLAPQRGFLSLLVSQLANQWLQDQQNQQASRLKPGEVLAWGDVYTVRTESTRALRRLSNLTQDWRVYLKVRYPDGREESAEGSVEALPHEAWTSPAPPRLGSLEFHVGRDGATIPLGKGWRWKLKPTAPGGQERLIDVPSPNPTVTLYIQLQAPPSTPPQGQ